MEDLGSFLGARAEAGDVVLLTGDLGAGKTCFSRGYLRAVVQDPALAVTSPTYLLDNTYEADEGELLVHHMDLYRLSGPKDLGVLGIPDIFSSCVCLIEWPQRLGELVPQERLEVEIRVTGSAASEDEDGIAARTVSFSGWGAMWEGLLDELRECGEAGEEELSRVAIISERR